MLWDQRFVHNIFCFYFFFELKYCVSISLLFISSFIFHSKFNAFTHSLYDIFVYLNHHKSRSLLSDGDLCLLINNSCVLFLFLLLLYFFLILSFRGTLSLHTFVGCLAILFRVWNDANEFTIHSFFVFFVFVFRSKLL